MNLFVLSHESPQTTSGGFPPAPPARARRAGRILLLDDEPCIRRLMGQFLVNAGYVVDTASDGEQGWLALNRFRYDVLLTDNDMPRLKGLGLIRRLRAAGMTLPVIVVSGSEELHRLPDLGALDLTAILPKPFDPANLLANLAVAMPETTSHARCELAAMP